MGDREQLLPGLWREREPGGLRYELSWTTDPERALMWFGALIALLLVLGVPLAMWKATSGIVEEGGDGVMLRLIGVNAALSVFLFSACFGGYAALTRLFNRTRYVVLGGRLTARHGPLPWPLRRTIDVDVATIERIELRLTLSVEEGGGQSLNASLIARRMGGEPVTLVHQTDRPRALRLREELEEWLPPPCGERRIAFEAAHPPRARRSFFGFRF